MSASGAGIAAAGIATAGVLLSPPTPAAPGTLPFGAGPERAAERGAVAFTVERNRDPAKDAPCVLDVVLVAPADPQRISFPCGDPTGQHNTLHAPLSRQDHLTFTATGATRLITSGTAPAATVAVTALDEHGQPLTATLHTPTFTNEVVFAMQSTGESITRLRYRLADGRYSEENSARTPRG